MPVSWVCRARSGTFPTLFILWIYKKLEEVDLCHIIINGKKKRDDWMAVAVGTFLPWPFLSSSWRNCTFKIWRVRRKKRSQGTWSVVFPVCFYSRRAWRWPTSITQWFWRRRGPSGGPNVEGPTVSIQILAHAKESMVGGIVFLSGPYKWFDFLSSRKICLKKRNL